MKKINKYISMAALLLAACAFTLTSCEDWLEEKPYDFILPEDVPDSDEGADMWAIGVYEALHSAMFVYGSFPRPLDYDCDYISGATWQFDQFGNGNFQGSNGHADALWNGMYVIVNRANIAMSEINKMQNVTETHRASVLGEMLFLKAWAYFYLVRAYGDIPVEAVSVNESKQYTSSPRIPLAQVYTEEIIPMLEEAKDNVYKNTDGNYKPGRISAATAAGMLTKVYATIASASMEKGVKITVKTGKPFQMENVGGTMTKIYTEPTPRQFEKDQVKGYEGFNSQEYYQKAYDLADEIVNKKLYGNHELVDYDLLWSKAGKVSSEFLFSLQTISGSEQFGTLFGYHYSGMLNEQGNIDNSLTVGCRKHWYLLFEEKDYRIDKGVLHCWIRENSDTSWGGGSYYPNFGKWQTMVQERQPPFDNSKVTQGWRCDEAGSEQFFAFTTKYSTQVSDQKLTRTDANYPFLRYADVVLLLAEAANELDKEDVAMKALNDVRIRSNATPHELSGYTTKEARRSAILEERAMEFAMEGDRRWDLIRWGIYLQAMNALEGTDEVGNVKARAERHLLFPIPVMEIATNLAINENNPGWR